MSVETLGNLVWCWLVTSVLVYYSLYRQHSIVTCKLVLCPTYNRLFLQCKPSLLFSNGIYNNLLCVRVLVSYVWFPFLFPGFHCIGFRVEISVTKGDCIFSGSKASTSRRHTSGVDVYRVALQQPWPPKTPRELQSESSHQVCQLIWRIVEEYWQCWGEGKVGWL